MKTTYKTGIFLTVLLGISLIATTYQLKSPPKLVKAAGSLTCQNAFPTTKNRGEATIVTIECSTSTEIPISGKILIGFSTDWDLGALTVDDIILSTPSMGYSLSLNTGTREITLTLGNSLPLGDSFTVIIGNSNKVIAPVNSGSYTIGVITKTSAGLGLDTGSSLAVIDNILAQATATATITNTFTASNTPTETVTISATATMTATYTETASNTPSNTATLEPSATSIYTETPTSTGSITASFTPTQTVTSSETVTASSTTTNSPTATMTATSIALTATATVTGSMTATPLSPSVTASSTATRTFTPSQTATPNSSASSTATVSGSNAQTSTPTQTAGSGTATLTTTITPTGSTTPTITPTSSLVNISGGANGANTSVNTLPKAGSGNFLLFIGILTLTLCGSGIAVWGRNSLIKRN